MQIFRRWKSQHVTVQTACHHHRQLRLKADPLLEHAPSGVEARPSLFDIDVSLEIQLALSKISEIGCLEHRGRPDKAERRAQTLRGTGHRERRMGKPMLAQEWLFPFTVLADV